MKTKTLLIAAVALTAGVVTSQAQVYSQNIVGYVNVVNPGGGKYLLLNNPLATGNDVLTNVLTDVQGGTIIQVWDGTTWNPLTYSGIGSNKHWKDGSSVIQDNTVISPGMAFFYQTPSAVTNTFVGSLVAASGQSATNALTGLTFAPVGSTLPFAGAVTNSSVNLVVGGGSILEQWDPVAQTFNVYTYSGIGSNKNWKDAGNVINTPVIGVGEGFFIQPSASTDWIQTAP